MEPWRRVTYPTRDDKDDNYLPQPSERCCAQPSPWHRSHNAIVHSFDSTQCRTAEIRVIALRRVADEACLRLSVRLISLSAAVSIGSASCHGDPALFVSDAFQAGGAQDAHSINTACAPAPHVVGPHGVGSGSEGSGGTLC